MFVSAVVVVAGLAAAALLVSNGALARAGVAALMTAGFSAAIVALAPQNRATLRDASGPVLRIRQARALLSSVYLAADPQGHEIAVLRRLLRPGRERWIVEREGRMIAEAIEGSAWSFLGRWLLGVFSRRWRANLRLSTGGIDCAALRRRGANGAEVEITNRALDPRIALALGVVIFGGER